MVTHEVQQEPNILQQSEFLKYEDFYLKNNQSVLSNNKIIQIIANLLDEILAETDKKPIQVMTCFHAKIKPTISLNLYLARINQFSQCSQECFILALIYIDRIMECNKKLILNSLNVHRLLLTSVMLAAKFFDDKYYDNMYYSKVGGIPCSEINQLEKEFLILINYRLYVGQTQYMNYRGRLSLAEKNLSQSNALTSIDDQQRNAKENNSQESQEQEKEVGSEKKEKKKDKDKEVEDEDDDEDQDEEQTSSDIENR